MHADAVLTLSLVVLGLTWAVLRGGLAVPAGAVNTGMTRDAAILGALAIAAAVWMFGLAVGLLVIAVIVVHEFGHVAAYRVAGHTDARFRLVPFLGGVAISNRHPASQLHDFYIAIMGPGICLALIAAGAIARPLLAGEFPVAEVMVRRLMLLTAAINFFNLLPVWPLDGGRVLRAITVGFWPMAAHRATVLFCLMAGVAAVATGRYLLLIIVLMGLVQARAAQAIPARMAPMRPREAAMALAAWVAMLGAYGTLGWPVLAAFTG